MARVNWEECVPGLPRGRWYRPEATMRPNGDIVFTRTTWDIMERPEHALVLYDRRSQTIGVKPVRAGITNTFRVQPHGRHGGRIVRAVTLCQQFLIKLERTVRFHDAEIDEDGVLNLDLSTATRAMTRPRVRYDERIEGSKA